MTPGGPERVAVLRFEVPGEPVPKARARIMNGHAFTPEKTRTAEELVRWCFRQAYPGWQPDGESRFVLVCQFFRKRKGRTDWDNLGKLVADALNGMVWVDDDQIDEAHCYKRPVTRDPKTIIEIWEVKHGN